MEILQVKDIYKDFSGLEVLTGVTFTVKANEKHAIIGPNGAGKTTLFNIISGKYRPSSGSILFKEKEVGGFSPQPFSTLLVVNIDLHPDPFCSKRKRWAASHLMS